MAGRKEGKIWQAHTKRHPWCLMSVQKYLLPPNSTEELQSHLSCMPILSSSSPGSPPSCLGAERHICTPTSHGLLLAPISVPQSLWRYAERKVLSQRFPSCCHRLVPTHAVQEHREFLPQECVQGDLSSMLMGKSIPLSLCTK